MPTTRGLSNITSKNFTVDMFVIFNYKNNDSYNICRYICDLSPFQISYVWLQPFISYFYHTEIKYRLHSIKNFTLINHIFSNAYYYMKF